MNEYQDTLLPARSAIYAEDEIVLHIDEKYPELLSPTDILSDWESKGWVVKLDQGTTLRIICQNFNEYQHEMVHLFWDIESLVKQPTIFFESNVLPKKDEVTEQFDLFVAQYISGEGMEDREHYNDGTRSVS